MFTSWDGKEDLESFEYLRALEAYFGEYATVVNTTQMAVQLCLELLGSRSHMIPTIMPATTSLEVFTGVMYSGALPIILDVDTDTFQVNTLQELLQDQEQAVVVLDRPGGRPVPPEAIEAVLDVPTIAVVRCPPHDEIDRLNLDATFTVFDLSEVIGTGAVIFQRNPEINELLKLLRGGPLGHKAWLPERLCQKALERFQDGYYEREHEYHLMHSAFDWLLKEHGRSDILWEASDLIGSFYFHVPDAARMVECLQFHGIPCRQAFYPLHTIPEVACRLSNLGDADYSGAEMLHKHTIMIPSHAGVASQIEFTVRKMMEELDG